MTFKPSPQQADFFKWITEGSGSCVLEAVAGAGKTTTLVKALNLMDGSIFFGAFNKKIAEEIKAKAPSKPGLNISTMHAAGFSAWRKATRFPQVDGDKVRNILRSGTNPALALFTGPITQLVSLAKQAALGVEGYGDIDDYEQWLRLVNHYGVETFDENTGQDNTKTIITLARKTLYKSIEQNVKIVDFDDMIYAPLYHGARIEKHDWVLIDEAQDTNASRRELALRLRADTGRLVAVGDRHQAIYGFTGADAKALDMIGDAVNATRLPLTTTFRCPKAVVTHAQQWVSHIQADATAPEGVVSTSSMENIVKTIQVGDAFLSRFNKPLISTVYALIAAGIPAKVEGRDIANGLKALASKWKVKSLDAYVERLTAWSDRQVKRFEEAEKQAQAQAISDKVGCMMVIVDRVRAINPTTKTPREDLIAQIDSIFGEDVSPKQVVTLSSIHKSKGREWHRVFWLQAENTRAKKEWEIEQEANLKYVAATRAMRELVLVA